MTRIHREGWAVFTPREFEVLQGMAAGWPSKDIARSLGLRVGTVRIYRQRIRHFASCLQPTPSRRVRDGVSHP
jgi:DNA-binding NarL/FixJ family response regulator